MSLKVACSFLKVHTRGGFAGVSLLCESLCGFAVPGRKTEAVAEVQQLNGYDGARLALPDSHGIGRGEQLADAFRAGDFHNPGTGRDQNAVFGEMHTFTELRAGVV
jgi:hypothetical protein